MAPKPTFQRSQSFNSKLSTTKTQKASNDRPPILPPPPPLYKAPTHTFSHNSSANSSILASASGMNNHLIKHNQISMPKLQPIGILTKPNPTRNNKASLPPLLIRPPSLQPAQSSLQTEPKNKTLLNQTIPQVKPNPINKPATTTTTNNNNNNNNNNNINNGSTTKVKNSENLSLKCKFCMEIFKGQSEFFQHVIVSHPKMLEQRLNRKRNTDSGTSSNPTNPQQQQQPSSTTFSTA